MIQSIATATPSFSTLITYSDFQAYIALESAEYAMGGFVPGATASAIYTITDPSTEIVIALVCCCDGVYWLQTPAS